MTVENNKQATQWLNNTSYVTFRKGEFIKDGFWKRLGRSTSSKYHNREVRKVISAVQKKWAASSTEESSRKLGDACVRRYGKSKIHATALKVLDRSLVRSRKKGAFIHPELQVSFAKWEKNGFSKQIFVDHPDFVDFLFKSRIVSQMKIFENSEKDIQMVEGQPALLVKGKPMKWSKIKETFILEDSPRYHETFLINKETREVYTYLGNGQGLQPFHPYLQKKLKPITMLDEKEQQRTLEKAREFVRPEEAHLSKEERAEKNKERTFVLQVVTSYVKGSNTNAVNFLYRKKHPYVRMIVGKDNDELGTKKGEVYEGGFGWKKKMAIPFINSQGQFRSPDTWEYMPCQEKVVTNIAVTQKEARNFYDYTMKYHLDSINLGKEIGFNLRKQNCSTYGRAGLSAAGIKIPTEISLPTLIAKVSPNWIQSIGRGYGTLKAKVGTLGTKAISILPPSLRTECTKAARSVSTLAKKMFATVVAFCLNPFRGLFGEFSGRGGKAFDVEGRKNQHIKPLSRDWKSYFKLSSYTFNLPGVLQEWQRKQASTVVYKKPTKLAIVPE